MEPSEARELRQLREDYTKLKRRVNRSMVACGSCGHPTVHRLVALSLLARALGLGRFLLTVRQPFRVERIIPEVHIYF